MFENLKFEIRNLMQSIHKTVLLKEAVESLNLKNGDIVIDATLGGGGHSRKIIDKIGEAGIFVGFDRDISALEKFAEFPISNFQFPNDLQIPIFKKDNIYLVGCNFSEIKKVLEILEIKKVDAILADFGLSSDQLDDAKRGFSFQSGGPLDMRMGKSPRMLSDEELTAEYVVNDYPEASLERIFRVFGEEHFAKRIARKIVEKRSEGRIKTTTELVGIISSAVPEKFKHRKVHFATRTFQALRIEVNKELESIEKFLANSIDILKKEGRLAVISFHSGEDRIAKNIFRENARGCICPKEFPVCRCDNEPRVKIITRKPVAPSEEEVSVNARSRSARMRVVEKI
ncbi:MAG: 16S rRNA (cytosine1402-N4)-methyltransferase [Candidatus Berkelbacteria bacterium Athens1014_28]|uniref:Ribosomal RNA small subunit methyltransferase H n=1 Tax=Candidatus Berkelbacteria bacterium Athens1014_28 TaxID=2017145 RepID=A0A554LPQ6_9BACT|nr:MAG: 16S rRNA (cytosine1402-N4)-methyltransferase [Candidatus Berkelbacteria bacterium Athens1014_28]